MSFTLPKISTAPTVTLEAENGALGGTEMASTYITVDVKKAAGIQTISWELLDRSSPAFYDQLIRELNDAYAKYTDTAMVAAFTNLNSTGNAGNITVDADFIELSGKADGHFIIDILAGGDDRWDLLAEQLIHLLAGRASVEEN